MAVHAHLDLVTDPVHRSESDQDGPVADLTPAPGDYDLLARRHKAQRPDIGQELGDRPADGLRDWPADAP
jgi:hypothetical protein